MTRTVNHPLPAGGAAVVFGATGGIGRALADRLASDARFARVLEFSRSGAHPFDLTDEDSIAAAAQSLKGSGLAVRLVIDATGALHGEGCSVEKSWGELAPEPMLRAFAINAIGPALIMKHVLPLLPAQVRSVFATISARVGSIGDNRLGGWYSYRASKAALNQIVRTAAIELRRKRPAAVCVALHPGTVDTPLSTPFGKAGLEVQTPQAAAARLLGVVDGLRAEQSGSFIDQNGESIPW